MWKKIQERIFPFIIATSALSVSASAAFYSISGLSKLFAGAAFAVIVMATSLEVAKLVIASLLYQYRKTIPKLLKYYLSAAAVVLVLITSMGIYGFLSSAYQETAAKSGSIDSQIALIETKRDNVREQLAVYSEEKTSINIAVSELRSGLSNNKIQYRDKETGQIITTTSSSTRKSLEKQLDQAIARQTEINTKVDNLNTQLFNYETEIVEVSTNNDIAGELGPLKYLSGLTGTPMDKIINYLLLTIIFVFDPLAIALVIAANYAFERLEPKSNIYGEKFVDGDLWEDEDSPNEESKQSAGRYKSSQLELNFDDRIPNLESQIQQLNNELAKFKKQIGAVVMLDGLEPEPEPKPITQEEYVQSRLKDLKSNMILGEFRERRLRKNLEKEYNDKKGKDEDLTIIY